MPRTSESIAASAAALAKAEAQLINPEKSMAATIRADGRGAAEQIFRYAPLSAGLDGAMSVEFRARRPGHCSTRPLIGIAYRSGNGVRFVNSPRLST